MKHMAWIKICLGTMFLLSCVRVSEPLRTLRMDVVGRHLIAADKDFFATVTLSYTDTNGQYKDESLSYTDMNTFARGFNIAVPLLNPKIVAYRAPSTSPESSYISAQGTIRIYSTKGHNELLGYSDGLLYANNPDSYINLQKAVYADKKLLVVFFTKDTAGKDAYMFLPPITIRKF